MQRITKAFESLNEYQQTVKELKAGRAQGITGLSLLPRAAITSLLAANTRQILLVAPNDDEAAVLYENLAVFLPETTALFPNLELFPFEINAQNTELRARRMSILARLWGGENLVVVAAADTLARRLPPAATLACQLRRFDVGGSYDFAHLSRELVLMGYERLPLVETAGSFCLRGDILDVFPIDAERPLRLSFFDDELESIRYFEPSDQLTEEGIDSFVLLPAREQASSEEALRKAADELVQAVNRLGQHLDAGAKRELRNHFFPLAESLAAGSWDSNMEQIACYLWQGASLCDYLGEDSLVILSEPQAIREKLEESSQLRAERYSELLPAGRLLPSFFSNFLDYPELKGEFLAHKLLFFSQIQGGDDLPQGSCCQIHTRDLPTYPGNPQLLAENCAYFRRAGYLVIFSASSFLRLNRVKEILSQLDTPSLVFLEAGFTRGFDCPELKLALISEKELLQTERKQRLRRKGHKGQKIENFLDLQEGDYVVHISQGIGRYLGVERLEVGDSCRDYLLIQYAGTDRLYLPVDQLDLIQKYIGNDAQAPKLYKLGGNEWHKVKAKVRASVKEMAKELLALYAERETAQGHAFAADNLWQKEFEDRFPFEETPDQLQAAAEIKQDMENSKPMDRLLCGDVGYGKTEVAMRAAFKATSDGKQVAVLAPTTVLVQQHYRTFCERFVDYPVKIACLSRFSTVKEQKEVLDGLKSGRIDLLIGTHRLLSKDIEFKDLGLLIVDEEQRFGVAHKEKIKSLKANIDVLVLTATPIPRTLHMAMTGMRDMSLIATPPEDRLPVQTYVLEYHDKLIKDAIKRELARGGQVYFVHNRIYNIELLACDIADLVPEAHVAIAHGQMSEKELEKVMMDFVEGVCDILLCTTIIESGLDIPNVNTLIVDEADTFGLAQLYQLRGRVGRSGRQAFAYFTYRHNRVMNETAKKRLVAIRDFTELGSGFKIAMRDLEIRGAGNILGPQQHGHIESVGFDLYCRLLQEEIAKGSGKAPEQEDVNTLMELDVNAYIPDDYIADSGLKIEIYRRIAGAAAEDELNELRVELQDRYGTPPAAVDNLLCLGKAKTYSRRLGIATITRRQGILEMRFELGRSLQPQSVLGIAGEYVGRIAFKNKKEFIIRLQADAKEDRPVIEYLIAFLRRLEELNAEEVAKASECDIINANDTP